MVHITGKIQHDSDRLSHRAVNKDALFKSALVALALFVMMPLVVFFFSSIEEITAQLILGALVLVLFSYLMSRTLIIFFKNYEIERAHVEQE